MTLGMYAEVVEFEGGGSSSTGGDVSTTSSGRSLFSASVPDVGRVEEWLAAKNLTVQEAALLVQTVNLLIVTFVMYRQVSS